MRDDEILDYFSNKQVYTCGRFREDQLKTYTDRAPKIYPGLTLLKAGFLSLLFILVSKPASAQTTTSKTKTEVVQDADQQTEANVANAQGRTILGVVKSEEDNEPLPGISIVLRGTPKGTCTDADGRFEFPQKLNDGDVLVFSFIGLHAQEYVVPRQGKEAIEIRMKADLLTMTGEVIVAGMVYTEPQSRFNKFWRKVKGLF
jgi:hypothetical protein